MKNHPDAELADNFTASESGMNRRQFLKLTGGGIFLFFTIGDLETLAQQRQGRSLPSDFNAFLRIGEDGRVTCYTGKIEMGQGVCTSLPQMLADELDVSVDSVDIVMGDTELCPWDMGTFGSMSTRLFGQALRSAGAEARGVLVQLASEHLGIPEKNLAVENGVVFDTKDEQRKVSYGELAKGKKIERHLSEKQAVKKPSQFKVMTKPLVHADGRDKVTGKAKYAGDIQLPGMLYAKILRPPAHGSKLIDVDLSGAKAMEGLEVIRDGDFVAVLHKSPDLAELGLSKIKAKFDRPQSDLDDKNIFDHLLKVAPEGNVVAKNGDLESGARESLTVVEETYLDGYKAHAPIEPHTAVVNIEGGKTTVWSSSQTPFSLKEEVAKELGCAPENVHVISPFVGGGFGGKSRNQQAVEAARLAKRTGKPVQVAWTRREEFFYDSFRPAAIVKIKSGVTGNGRISLWDYHVYYAGERGAQQFYDVPHHATTVHNSSWTGAEGSHPFSTGPWRAPGNSTNTFARESQIDIMASKAQVDPLEFRIGNLSDKKMQRVLTAAAGKFGWKPAKAPSGRGYGIACGMDAGAYVAAFAEVDVDKASGNVHVKRVVCAQDMGLAVNPEGAAIQMEGCITMGLGYALREHIRFKAGEIFDVNFDSYEIPRFSWLPEIETIIIEDNDSAPQGGGEPAIITMGAVVANAVFDATGIRMFELPLSPEKIKEAVKKG